MSGDDDAHPMRDARGAFDGVTAIEWVDVCVDLAAADGAALVVAAEDHPDTHQVVHATDGIAVQAADLGYILGCGPHIEAMSTSNACAVDVDDAADRGRWPLLVDELAVSGIGWVQAHPLGDHRAPLGTLQLYRRTRSPHRLSGDDRATHTMIAQLARMLGTGIVAAGVAADMLIRRHQDSEAVNIAIGILAARHGCTVAVASAMLRAGAYSRGHGSAGEAHRVIDTINSVDP